MEQIQLSLDLDQHKPLASIRARLLALHGPQRDSLRHDPASQFVKALISSCTRDAVSERSYQNLRRHFATWEDLAQSTPEIIHPLIADVTRSRDQTRHLLASVQHLIRLQGRFDLAYLAPWPLDAALHHLLQFEGIGPKCAAATLNFSTLRRRVLVVDRHVQRVCTRLGFLPDRADGEKAHRLMMHHIPAAWDADDLYELHWLIKRFGQEVCTARRPGCIQCVLALQCRMARTKRGPSCSAE